VTTALDAIGRPVTPTSSHSALADMEREAIDASNGTTAALCMASSDPYRALAGGR
jgi:hypothetical protein